MAVPRLNICLVLEAAQRQSDGLGGYRSVWAPLGNLWAEMRAGPGSAKSAEVGAQSVVGWRITVRGAVAGDPRRPVPGQRFALGSRRFLIDAVAERDLSGRWLVCHASEEVQA